MNIAYIEEHSYIYGPGCRFVIWVQGCSIHCKGCWNQSMWNFEPNMIIPVEELFLRIFREKESIEGITILGGEPLDQYEDTLHILSMSKNAGLDTMLFTGYTIPELKDKGMNAIFDVTGILITGRYEQDRRTIERQWIGSTNQEIHFLSERWKNFEKIDANYVEISIDTTGSITILGFPDEEFI
ncbi:MAG: radical SAM protein [Treponema sp.]|jgi:anaerobic ribonucleoside-triphosphate reductase activating protein|nr:radical SAM protein [Treponema sp.]